ncbi:MAG: phosphate propanoyltransferase [Oscillospiraceae bacterium]|jgi:putative phosphotransacetylase|nr:phosphate propanoyltransferase [Oscillospiraceae bacterium]
MKVLVEVSARHVHLSRDAIDSLFGRGYELRVKRALSQPGQFLSEEKVDLVCGKNILKGISILGPERDRCQIEISRTDARNLKIDVPLRESGDLDGSAGCIISAAARSIRLNSGIIVAKRHIHMTPEDAKALNLSDGSKGSINLFTERPLIFKSVIVRISEHFALAAHIDADEGNAAGINGSCEGEFALHF